MRRQKNNLMIDDQSYNQALNLAYFFLKFRLRTEKEIRNYLIRKSKKYSFSDEIINKVIIRLKDLNLIDDKKFLEVYIESRNRNKQKSQFILRLELIKLGIDELAIGEYFDKNLLDEFDLAKKAFDKHCSRWQNISKEKRLQKATQFLLRRGFGFDVIKKTLADSD
jgi:regulatory protein